MNLSGLTCKCTYIFCSKHRLPESHNCNFDHKKNDKAILEKNLVKCAKAKIEQI